VAHKIIWVGQPWCTIVHVSHDDNTPCTRTSEFLRHDNNAVLTPDDRFVRLAFFVMCTTVRRWRLYLAFPILWFHTMTCKYFFFYVCYVTPNIIWKLIWLFHEHYSGWKSSCNLHGFSSTSFRNIHLNIMRGRFISIFYEGGVIIFKRA